MGDNERLRRLDEHSGESLTRRNISMSSGTVSPERSSHSLMVSAEAFCDVQRRTCVERSQYNIGGCMTMTEWRSRR